MRVDHHIEKSAINETTQRLTKYYIVKIFFKVLNFFKDKFTLEVSLEFDIDVYNPCVCTCMHRYTRVGVYMHVFTFCAVARGQPWP